MKLNHCNNDLEELMRNNGKRGRLLEHTDKQQQTWFTFVQQLPKDIAVQQ
jgi:hypothetical protein